VRDFIGGWYKARALARLSDETQRYITLQVRKEAVKYDLNAQLVNMACEIVETFSGNTERELVELGIKGFTISAVRFLSDFPPSTSALLASPA